MPAVRAGLEIGGKPTSTSQPGTADSNKLRAWTDRGMGSIGAIQAQAQRLFRTEEEGSTRPRPHIVDVDDVTRGLGLDDTDRTKITTILTQTGTEFGMSEKTRSQRYPFALKALSEFLNKTSRFTSDQRMEIRRRANEWWRKFGKTTYEGRPMIRHLITKAQLDRPTLFKADGGEPQQHGGGGGPYIGPRGGKWADPQHTVPYTDIDKYKMRVSGEGHQEMARKLEEGIKAAGDICKITPPICHGNLGIERKEMPQIPDDVIPGFLKTFQDKGIKVTKDTMAVGQLKATQKEINAEKVVGMANAYKEGKYDPSKQPIIVSKDGFVLDGHHRWAAMVHDDPSNKMRVFRVDTDIKTLLHAAQNHEGVNYGQGFGAASDIKGGKGGDAKDIKEAAQAGADVNGGKPGNGVDKDEKVAEKALRMEAIAASKRAAIIRERGTHVR